MALYEITVENPNGSARGVVWAKCDGITESLSWTVVAPALLDNEGTCPGATRLIVASAGIGAAFEVHAPPDSPFQ